jgi:hypothetical protein
MGRNMYGPIRGPLTGDWRGWWGDAATAKNKAMFPPDILVGAVEPDAIVGVIAFLVSDAAASIGGALIPTYGG